MDNSKFMKDKEIKEKIPEDWEKELRNLWFRGGGQSGHFLNALIPFIEKKKAEWMEELEDIYSELRGLLKEHAQFPDMWNTDERLREWLEENNQL